MKAALANNATSQAAGGGSTVTFTVAGHRYEGTINAQNQVDRVRTWIDNSILGDTLVETVFTDTGTSAVYSSLPASRAARAATRCSTSRWPT